MKKIIIFAAALAALVSCNKSVIVSSVEAEEPGFISLGISTSDVMVETKGLAANNDLTSYNITLINKSTSKTVWTKEYEAAQTDADAWKVAPGTYTIKVENKSESEVYPNNTSAGEIRIAGETDVTVNAGQTSTCTVSCVPVNAKVSFCATSEFFEVFSAASVSVTDGTRSVDLGSVGTDFGAEAFYNPGEITWNLSAKIGETTKPYSGVVKLSAKKWSKVTFGTSSTNGVINITINVNGTMEGVDVPTTVDPLQ